MPSNPSQDGAAFATDLRAIRESQGVSLADLHDQSKIPMDLLEGFERDALFSHGSYNLVYLRSLMRTYVEPLGMEEDVALGALEAAWEGQYNRELAVAYSGLKAPAPRAPEAKPKGEAAETARQSTQQSAPQQPARKPTAAPARKPAAPKVGNAAARKPDTTKTPAPKPRASTPPPPRARAYEKESSRPPWLLALLGGLGLVLVGWAVFALVFSGDDPDAGAPEEVAVADTLVAPAPEPTPTRPPAVLGSPMQVVIGAKAESDGLQEIRVTVDDDLRRPYWVEAGESQTFTPADRIVIENELADATITLDGYAFPTVRRDAQGRIVIDRASGQAHLDSVSVR